MTSAAPEDQQPDRLSRVSAAVDGWRQQLTEVGGPNALLWFAPVQNRALVLGSAHPAGVARLLAGHQVRLSDLVRSSDAYADAGRRARAIRAGALELWQERGLRTCYLAIGLASWDVPPSYPSRPCAPVLLRRATLRPVDATERDFHLDLDDVIEPNGLLLDYLRSARGIDIDPDRLVDQAGRQQGSPEGAYDVVRDACAGLPGFVVQPSLVIATFSPAKAPAISDLASAGDALAAHPVIAALAGDPEALEAAGALAAPRTGEPDLATERLVLDADSAQQSAIEAIQAGSHLVLHGPPGTGKTQTIANLIATMAAQGRRVLLVAEKRAAIEAVTGRLAAVGLDHLVLDTDAHTGGASPLVATVDSAPGHGAYPVEVDHLLASTREQLEEHRRRVHEAREPWGVSVDEAQARISELGALPHPPHSRVRLLGTHLHHIPAERLPEIRGRLVAVAQDGAWSTGPDPDPWYGARVVGNDQTTRVRDLVQRLSDQGLADYRGRVGDLAEQVGLERPRSVLAADEQLDLMGKVFGTLEIFRSGIFEAPLAELVAATGARSKIGLLDRRRLRAQARELLRPGPPPRDLHGVLARAAEQKQLWRERSGPGSLPSAPVEVPRVLHEHEQFREELEWLAARLEPTRGGGDLIRADFDQLQRRLERLAAAGDRLLAVPRTISQADALRRENLGPLIDDLAAQRVPVERVPDELDFVWWSSVLDEIKSKDAAYGGHDGDGLRRVWEGYARADRAHIAAGAGRVRSEVAGQVARAAADFPEQVQLLRAYADERTVPWRELMSAAPELLTSVRPCWAMSPLTVAATVPLGMWFDVVVFDESSAIALPHAISAIARAEQVVVVGDHHQLRPTAFRVSDDAAAAGAPERSLLDAVLPALPVQSLTWHYRSQDERLIAFSNAQVYRGGLVTFARPGGAHPVQVELVPGARGDGESSPQEVDAVARIVQQQLAERPDESVAVVAFSRAHADAIRQALAGPLAAAAGSEPLVVLTPDLAQGLERDAVVVAVGHGRDARGEVSYRLGVLSSEGGEAALTVALTRARRRTTVVSSVAAADLAPAQLRSRGAQMLRDLLLFAGGEQRADEMARGGVARVGGRRRRVASTGSVLNRPTQPERPTQPLPSVLADLAERLRSKGLVVHERYGSSPWPLDLAVADPSRPDEPLIAVETDGPAYAQVSGVRDRDRLRPERLQQLGWSYERVWTVDVFRDPARDVARIQSRVEELIRARTAKPRLPAGDGQ